MAGRSKFDTGERVWKKVEGECAMCGKHFVGATQHGRGGKFCSKKCAAESLKKPKPGVVTEFKTCLNCHEDFAVATRKSRRKFCSSQCSSRFHGNWGNVEVPCCICGKLILRRKDKLAEGSGKAYCSYDCMAVSRILPYPKSGKWAAVSKWFRRYGRMTNCERCGYDQVPEILILHHKDRNRNNNARSNIAILCPNCHALDHLDENKSNWKGHLSTNPVKIALRAATAAKRQNNAA